MQGQRSRSLTILARVQAIVSGLVAVTIFALYGLRPSMLTDVGVSLTAAILGTVSVVYFLTLHQVLSRTRVALSTLLMTIITAANIVLVIASTGGLDSPFYSLWLLAIVVTGIFGTAETVGLMGFTIIYYVYELYVERAHAPYLKDHLIQLAITLIAGALAQWVYSRNARASAASSKVASLSGQLSTEQLKAEAIISNINEGVMVVDSNRKIQLFNRAAQELTGWDESSAKNIDFNLVMQFKDVDDKPITDATDPFTEAWNNGSSVVRDNLVTTTRAGRKTQLSLSISPIFDAQQHASGAIALFRDISKEKEVERQKDEFVSTASHEMRTPVAAIEGYISLAMNPNVATVDDRAKKYLEKAHDTIGHLGELFRDLLSVTKAEQDQLGDKLDAVNLGQLLQAAADDMQIAAQKKSLTLIFQIGNQGGKTIAPLYYVAANGERLREVLMNLMENAIKYTPEGGIKVTLDGDEKEVTVGVSDSGVGIAPEDMPHLFQKFYRIDNSATRTIGGTGLGLYLCRKVIELFNGRIWVESKPGEGSTFKFSLPRMKQDEVTRMQEASKSAATAPGTSQATAPGDVIQPGTPVKPPAPPPAPAVAPAPLQAPVSMPVPNEQT